MILLYVLLLFVISILCYFFFAPFYLEINTVTNLYRIRFHYLVYLSFKIINDELITVLKIGFWEKQILLNDLRKIKKNKPFKSLKTTDVVKKMKRVLKSFEMTRCIISIDTGNIALNGILYPLFCLITFYSKKEISINFENVNKIDLQIKNNLAKLTWAYIKS